MKHRLLTGVTAFFCAAAFLTAGAYAGGKKAASKDGFAGSKACQKCHKAEYESWDKSLHSKMVRTKDDGILKAVVEKWATDGTTPGPTKGNVTGDAFTISDVDLVIGSHWKQRFMVRNKLTGNHQFMDKQFNRMSEKWEPYGQKNDWEFMCATCHTTGYRLTSYDPANPKDAKAAYTELSVGCEACHGPGAKHLKSKSKKDIWNPAAQPKEVQTRACGYCHIRGENELYMSPQGNAREDLPAPKVGESFKPSDDWTKWYPEHFVLPGVHPEDKIDAEYKGDLKGMFIVDDISKKNNVFEEGKHHQEYQGFIQSKHYKSNVLGCNDCHTPHAGKKIKAKVAADTCKGCHGDTYSVDKIMPGTGKTADNLYLRTHTFFKDQARPSKPLASGTAVLNKEKK
jgi:hypothetical protein